MSYKHLSFNQRCQIAAFYKVGYLQKDIAIKIGVSTSTISREIKRNSRWNGVYSPEQADSFYQDRRRKSKKTAKFTANVQKIVKEKLLLQWSSEQISGYAKRHNLFSISHERIYQFVLCDKKLGGQLYKHLCQEHRKYRKRYGSPQRTGPIKNRVWIDDRSKIVEEKSRIGDWEIDTIIGK